jgi:hypothetical protein
VADAVAERTAVGLLAPLDGARDADELALQRIAAGVDDRVAVPADVEERQVGRERGVGDRQGLAQVAGLLEFEAGADAVPKEEVDRGPRPRLVRPTRLPLPSASRKRYQ